MGQLLGCPILRVMETITLPRGATEWLEYEVEDKSYSGYEDPVGEAVASIWQRHYESLLIKTYLCDDRRLASDLYAQQAGYKDYDDFLADDDDIPF